MEVTYKSQLLTMQNQQIVPEITVYHQHDLEQMLRSNYPNRNEKYYYILLKAREHLIKTSSKLSLTAEAIIKDSESARPTWYTYFKSVEGYYKEVLEILGNVMMEYAFAYLRANATYKDWILVSHSLKMMVFLSNTRNLVGFYPALKKQWYHIYDNVIEEYASILSPILKLSPRRAQLFMKNIANEMILHPDIYHTDLDLFERFVNREYILFLAEQNS